VNRGTIDVNSLLLTRMWNSLSVPMELVTHSFLNALGPVAAMVATSFVLGREEIRQLAFFVVGPFSALAAFTACALWIRYGLQFSQQPNMQQVYKDSLPLSILTALGLAVVFAILFACLGYIVFSVIISTTISPIDIGASALIAVLITNIIWTFKIRAALN